MPRPGQGALIMFECPSCDSSQLEELISGPEGRVYFCKTCGATPTLAAIEKHSAYCDARNPAEPRSKCVQRADHAGTHWF